MCVVWVCGYCVYSYLKHCHFIKIKKFIFSFSASLKLLNYVLWVTEFEVTESKKRWLHLFMLIRWKFNCLVHNFFLEESWIRACNGPGTSSLYGLRDIKHSPHGCKSATHEISAQIPLPFSFLYPPRSRSDVPTPCKFVPPLSSSLHFLAEPILFFLIFCVSLTKKALKVQQHKILYYIYRN